MPTFNHDLSDLAAAMDAKIAALTSAKDAIQAVVTVADNQAEFNDVSTKLASLQAARAFLEASCCGQSCQFNWEA